MKERVAVPMMINEIKEAKQGDILMFDGKRWVPASFKDVSSSIIETLDNMAQMNQNALKPISTALDKIVESYNLSQKAYLEENEKRKVAFAVSMAFDKIAIDEIIGDSGCADFESLRDWHNQFISGSTTKLSDDPLFIKYFNMFKGE